MEVVYENVSSARIALVFFGQEDFVRHVLRPAEFNESPKFASTVFSIGEYLIEGEVENYEDNVAGVNLSRRDLDRFRETYGTYASPEERMVCDLDADYVIAINCPKSEDMIHSVIIHELSHALYSTDAEYKTVVDAIYDSIPTEQKTAIRDLLLADGYTEDRLADEFAAYILDTSMFRRWKKRLALYRDLRRHYTSKVKSRTILKMVDAYRAHNEILSHIHR